MAAPATTGAAIGPVMGAGIFGVGARQSVIQAAVSATPADSVTVLQDPHTEDEQRDDMQIAPEGLSFAEDEEMAAAALSSTCPAGLPVRSYNKVGRVKLGPSHHDFTWKKLYSLVMRVDDVDVTVLTVVQKGRMCVASRSDMHQNLYYDHFDFRERYQLARYQDCAEMWTRLKLDWFEAHGRSEGEGGPVADCERNDESEWLGGL
ncbi:hypothetical protein LTR17_019490 [Elasticomyces elasticus]|nr:hypothetical protein LTR17_019490 [Elasticomyces elasticus]